MNILVCQLRSYGDVIRTFPLIDAIKSAYPRTSVGFTCLPEMMEVLALCSSVDTIISQPRLLPIQDTIDNTRICNVDSLRASVEQARQACYDLYIDLHGVFQSAVFGIMSQIPVRLGRSHHTCKDGADMFYTINAEVIRRDTNRMERHFVVARQVLDQIQPPVCTPRQGGDQVLFVPGSSAKGWLKRWPTDSYLDCIQQLALDYPVQVILTPEEHDLAPQFTAIATGRIRVDTVQHWAELLAQVVASRVVVGNDCAALHLAIWQQVPTIMICGPTSGSVNGVWPYASGVTINTSVLCACTDVWQAVCNCDQHCMRAISVNYVIEQFQQLELGYERSL